MSLGGAAAAVAPAAEPLAVAEPLEDAADDLDLPSPSSMAVAEGGPSRSAWPCPGRILFSADHGNDGVQTSVLATAAPLKGLPQRGARQRTLPSVALLGGGVACSSKTSMDDSVAR